jgi:hypothetical protein
MSQPASSTFTVASGNAQPITIVAGSRKPWLTKFSGDDGYELWRHQLLSLRRESYQPRDIADAIRSSLQGKAGQILLALGPDASVDSILAKLDSVYGQCDENPDVLAAFFSARQGPTESVADWSCRVEGLFARARRVNDIAASEEALRQMFWTGLRQQLKDASTFYYTSIKSFDELRMAVRRVEKQHPTPATEKKASCNAAQGAPRNDTLEAMVKQLAADMKSMKQELTSLRKAGTGQQPQPTNTQPSYGASRGGQHQQGQRRQRNNQEVVCFRCGEKGHVKSGCRANIDHLHRQPDFGYRL